MARVGLFFAGPSVFLYTAPRRCMASETALYWTLVYLQIIKSPVSWPDPGKAAADQKPGTRPDSWQSVHATTQKNRGTRPRLKFISFILFFACTLFIRLDPDAAAVLVLSEMAPYIKHAGRACVAPLQRNTRAAAAGF